jgi:hypothetical protein
LQWLKSTYAKENITIAYFPPPSPDIIVVKTEKKYMQVYESSGSAPEKI